MADWQGLANSLNSMKASRNATPGYTAVTAANATSDPATIETLILAINEKDATKYSMIGYNFGISDEEKYTTASIKYTFLNKKIVKFNKIYIKFILQLIYHNFFN